MMRAWALIAVVAIVSTAEAQDRPSPTQPGIFFQSAETQALQADETRNPGMLWVEQGGRLWNERVGSSGKSCANCHGAAETSMKGVAARYPVALANAKSTDPNATFVVTLEGWINVHRERAQGAAALAYESPDLLSLSAFLAYQSRGLARTRASQADARGSARHIADGHRLFHTRQGQLNLSCAQCHDDLVGKKLRGDTISQAQTHGWPAYRLEWQTMGSLQRRLRACSLGVRAEVLDYGHPDYLALEYYLAWRGEGLPMESPGVRR